MRIARTRTSIVIPVNDRLYRVGFETGDEMTPGEFIDNVGYMGMRLPSQFMLLLLAEYPDMVKLPEGFVFNETTVLARRGKQHYEIVPRNSI